MGLTLTEFVSRLTASELMTADELRAVMEGLACGQQSEDGEQLARELVRLKRLTPYQATAIYQGQAQRLTLGNYVILDKLGEGGMGMVLKAEHRRMKRLVALKVMSGGAMKSPDALKRFQREVQAAARLSHPHIVAAFDADEAKGTAFLVMEYVEGTDLSSLVRKQGQLPIDRAVHCVLQAAQGLQYAHQQGVIHRDIKPANLLLDLTGTVKILDMGLARIESEPGQAELTQSGAVMGTVDYMAPEQALNTKTADARSDIYSLGISLWYLLTARPAYSGDSLTAKLLAHQGQDIPSLQQARPGVPARLDAIFRKMVAKKPADRHQSMADVIRDLQSCLSETASAPVSGAASAEQSPYDVFVRSLEGQSHPAHELRPAAAATPAVVTTAPHPSEGTISSSHSAQNTEAGLPRVSAVSQVPQQSVRPVPAGIRPPLRRNRRLLMGAAVAGLLAIAVALLLLPRQGSLLLEIADPEIEVRVRGTKVVLKGTNPDPILLAPGEYILGVRRGATRVETQPISLGWGESIPISVRLVAGRLQVTRGDTLISQEPGGVAGRGASKKAGSAATAPDVKLELSSLPPLGTWRPGPAPPWIDSQMFRLQTAPVLPGVIERPREVRGVARWNLDTVWPRGMIHSVRYSPDGKWIAVSSSDGHLRICDAATMRLTQLLPGVGFQGGVVDFSWHPDSERLAVVGDSGWVLRIWSRNGTLLFEENEGGDRRSVAWSHDGKYLAETTGGRLALRNPDGTLFKILRDGELQGSGMGNSLAWSFQGRELACSHLDRKIRIWDIESGDAMVLHEFREPRTYCLAWNRRDWIAVADGVNASLYGPDRKLSHIVAFTGNTPVWRPHTNQCLLSNGGELTVWDCDQQRSVLQQPYSVVGLGPLPIAFDCSPDGKRVMSGAGDLHGIELEGSSTWFQTPPTVGAVSATAWSADGVHLATGSGFGSTVCGLRIWSASGIPEAYLGIGGYHRMALAWRPDGQVLATSDGMGVHLGRATSPLAKVLEADSTSLAWNRDGRFLAVGRIDGGVDVLNSAGQKITELQTGGPGGVSLSWSRVTNLLAARNGRRLFLCDPQDAWFLRPFADLPNESGGISWSPDGTVLSVEGGAWYGRNGKTTVQHPVGHPTAWRGDGAEFVTNGLAVVPRDGTVARSRYFNGVINSVAWHPRGNLIVTGTAQSSITGWDSLDLEPNWHAVMLPDQKSATFSAAGELVSGTPDLLEKHFAYYADRGDKRIEMLTPGEFQTLIANETVDGGGKP